MGLVMHTNSGLDQTPDCQKILVAYMYFSSEIQFKDPEVFVGSIAVSIPSSTGAHKIDVGFVNNLKVGKGSQYHWSQFLVPR